MSRTLDVPWLCDRHSHVSLYAALGGCPSLAGLEPEAAMDLLRSLPGDRVTLVTGWHNSRLKLGADDLAALPPAILVNFSFHGYALTAGAKRLLAPEHPDLVARVDDLAWCELNLERLLQFFGRTAGLTPAGLDTFMTGLQKAGIGAAEDMLLTGREALGVILASPWRGRVRCWATPALFRSLDPEDQEAITGLKLFTDGALGARTAGMGRPFLDGTEGLLLYSRRGWRRSWRPCTPWASPWPSTRSASGPSSRPWWPWRPWRPNAGPSPGCAWNMCSSLRSPRPSAPRTWA